ncbi:MAG: hypothetical protein AAF399_05190 [Bacteroidota bacterium]
MQILQMKKNIRLIGLILVGILPTVLWSQTKEEYFLLNSQVIEEVRYVEIDGSPFQFEDWQTGTVYTIKLEMIKNVELNYNGYEHNFEAKKGRSYISLDDKWYLRIELGDSTDRKIFQRGVHQKFAEKWVQVLHPGKYIMLVKLFEVKVATKTIQDVGKTVKIKRFFDTTTYYLIQDGELTMLKAKKKPLLKKLGFRAELEAFIKANDLDLKTDQGLQQLIAHYETLANP